MAEFIDLRPLMRLVEPVTAQQRRDNLTVGVPVSPPQEQGLHLVTDDEVIQPVDSDADSAGLEAAPELKYECGTDPDLFHSPDYRERKVDKERREMAAKAICSRCFAKDSCLSKAVRNGYDQGVWGGLDELERKALRRRISRTRSVS